jgi:hypothetical protein
MDDMKSKLIGALVAALTLTMAGLAMAQTSTPGVGTGPENKGLDMAETKAADQAKPELEAIRTRARTLSPKEAEATEPKIDAMIKGVDTEAAKADSKVPDRLATRFGITPDALVAEKAKFGAGFGELMIAHLLLSDEKSGTTVTLDDLFKMHGEGMGWGQIAHGMGLKLGGLVSAARNEGREATGKGKPGGGEHGATASKGAPGTMEHGSSATAPGHMMGGGAAAAHHGK